MSVRRGDSRRFVMTFVVCFFFFFSSRRRHTRFDCDWSSDVCSSDLFFISDRPGVLGGITATIGEKGGNILEVLHHRTMLTVPPKGASVDVTVETQDRKSVV